MALGFKGSSVFKVIKKIVTSFLALHAVARYLILSVLSAMFGAGYVGIISEFASYYFAWQSGFRIPAEGIPYLAMTISTISFFLFIVFAVVFALVYLMGLFFTYYAVIFSVLLQQLGTDVKGGFLSYHSKVRELPIWAIFLIGTGLGFSLWGAFSIVELYRDSFSFDVWRLLRSVFLGVLLLVLIWNKRMLVCFALLMSLLTVVTVPYALFNTSNYAHILQDLRYGGGIDVLLTLKSSDELHEYELLMRTSKALILRDAESRVVEVPMDNIVKINYGRK